jgi:hypothetical protein
MDPAVVLGDPSPQPMAKSAATTGPPRNEDRIIVEGSPAERIDISAGDGESYV